MNPVPEYPFSRPWVQHGEVAVIGSAFDAGGVLHSGRALAVLFSGVASEEAFVEILRSLNGQFAVSLEKPHFKAAAVDRIRSIPILFRRQPNGFEIVASGERLSEDLLHPEAAATFAKAWCTPGNLTLHREVFQLQAGQYLWAGEATDASPKYYAYHMEPAKRSGSRETMAKEAAQVIDRMADRMINVLNGRTAVVPLSGGYDSRLILSLLHQKGYPDIIAYTYGDPKRHEAKIARRVTQRLGIPWHMVPYTTDVFSHFFTERWKSYSRHNHFYTSLPHEQDFFALNHLKEQGWLPDGFLALPGFCGDILGGSITAVPPSSYNPNALAHYIRENWLGAQSLELQIDVTPASEGETAFLDAFQHWYVCHKESKFVVNGVRVYEHFGGDWHLPLWDLEFQQFWYAVPYALRKRQSLYNEVLFDHCFTLLDIAFRKPAYDDNYPSSWRLWLRKHLPQAVVSAWKRHRPASARADVNSLSVLNAMICRELNIGPGECPPEVNDSHAIYFLQNLNK